MPHSLGDKPQQVAGKAVSGVLRMLFEQHPRDKRNQTDAINFFLTFGGLIL